MWWETKQSGWLGWWIKVSLTRMSLPWLVVAGVAVEDTVVCLCWGTNCFDSLELLPSQPLHPVSQLQRLMCAAGVGYELWEQAYSTQASLSKVEHPPSVSWVQKRSEH